MLRLPCVYRLSIVINYLIQRQDAGNLQVALDDTSSTSALLSAGHLRQHFQFLLSTSHSRSIAYLIIRSVKCRTTESYRFMSRMTLLRGCTRKIKREPGARMTSKILCLARRNSRKMLLAVLLIVRCPDSNVEIILSDGSARFTSSGSRPCYVGQYSR